MNFNEIWSILFPYIVIFVLFYIVLILPQRRREKKIRQMLASLKEGNTVMTIGGIIGTIVSIKENEVLLEVGEEKAKIKIAKWAVKNVEEDKKEE